MVRLHYKTLGYHSHRPHKSSSNSPLPLRKHQLQPPRRRRKLIPHIPHHRLPLARARRERHVEPAQQCRRHGPDLHQRQLLPHAAEAALGKGRKGRLVEHEVGRRGPPLGDKVERAREARGQTVQGVEGQVEGGGGGDEGGGDGEAFGGRLAQTARGDGRVQAEGFVDGAVEVGEGLEGAGVRGRGEGVKFGADFGGVGGVEGEVVEEHDEGGGGGVRAGDDDAKGVAVEPAAVGLERVVGSGRVDEPGGDVVVVAAVVLAVDAFAHLGVGPDEHGFPTRGHAGDAEAYPREPGCGCEEREEHHAVAHQADDEMGFSRREHVEGLAKGELAHEVEGEVVEP